MFAGFAAVSALAGIGFLAVCLILWIFAWREVSVLFFGSSMFFAGFANYFAFHVFDRLESAGYKVGFWRGTKDFQLYSEYWRVAPQKQWSRFPIVGLIGSAAVAAALLFATMYIDSLPK